MPSDTRFMWQLREEERQKVDAAQKTLAAKLKEGGLPGTVGAVLNRQRNHYIVTVDDTKPVSADTIAEKLAAMGFEAGQDFKVSPQQDLPKSMLVSLKEAAVEKVFKGIVAREPDGI